MNRLGTFDKSVSRAIWWVLSIPLFFKIMGIGLVVGAVFGGVTLWLIHGSVSHMLHEMLEARTRSVAQSLVAGLERPLSTGDLYSVNRKLRRTREMFLDVRYAIVRDAGGRIVAHTFDRAVPDDLAKSPRRRADSNVQVLSSREGLLFDVVCPILDGDAGTLQLGLTDETIAGELAAVTKTVWLSLLLCAVIGAGLALLLTHILTRPIRHLVQAAKRVREGDFQTRSEIFSADEIGRLAVAFNQMTESLDGYRREVQEKEAVRVSLIEKIVHTQEEERKSISRELHDQLGQSLLALLLVVQSLRKEQGSPSSVYFDVEQRIRQLIDDVRRLSWGMRPSILDDYGLDFALARHVEEISSHFELPIDYQYSGAAELGRLPDRIEVTLYRIAQEALTNIVRHAHATRASAVVLQRHQEVTMLIEDDGRGFNGDPLPNRGARCLGLTGMKERAALLGGTCAVESVREQGTTIRVTIPLDEAEACRSESCLEVVGETGDGLSTIEAVDRQEVDVLLLDITMPKLSGPRVAEAVLKKRPHLAIVVLTMHEDEYYLQELFKIGARGFVLKKSTGTDLLQAIRAADRGQQYIDPALAGHVISSYVGRQSPGKAQGRLDLLTPREQEVCTLLAYGHTNAEIAGKLFISKRTVETHRTNLMAKLAMRSRAELVRFAIDNGLVKLG